jgi:hypothetical protein
MRSGSPAHDGDGWPSAQHPYRDDTLNGAGPYGPGRRGEPHEGQGERGGVPFGPEISWPNGFRQIDPEARFLLESGYGRSQYDHVDPGYGTGGYATGGHGTSGYGTGGYATGGYGTGGYGTGSAYREPGPSGPPPADDYGYGDPGYSDPSYDGPGRSSGTGGPGYGGVAGYRAPDYRESSRPDPGYQSGFGTGMYPVTGAQEALPATGPQPVADWGSRRDAGYQQGGYPEQWYDHPRMVDPRGGAPRDLDPRASDPRASDPRAFDPRAFDPRSAFDRRLDGIRYDELRYDDSAADGPRYDEPRYDEPRYDEPRYDEPLDESWVAELRRSAPTYPQHPGGDQRRGDPRGSDSRGGDLRGGDVRGPGRGQQPGSGPQAGYSQSSGYGQGQLAPGGPRGRDDRGGAGPMTSRGPRMSAAPDTGPASRTAAFPRDMALQGEGYVASSTQVGVLPPPATRRFEDPVDSGPMPAISAASSTVASPVRPGHGLDGPEITSSWPAQPSTEEVEAFEEFWSEDDEDADYPGLFPDRERRSGRPRRQRAEAGSRRTGRRRGRSSDHRLWLALVGVVVVAGGAIFGILKFEFPSHNGPVHELVTPARIGSYTRTLDLEKQTKINALREEVIKMSAGQARDVVDAVYESGDSAAGGNEQIVMFIGGHLANADPATSIASFTQKFAGAEVVSAGSLGGQAACVEQAGSAAMCVWFDDDSFGEFASPTMNADSLAGVMRAMRPSVELVVKK